jgi:caa(3)-type oxidase subunit IV
MADSPEAIQKSLRLYKLVGGVLFLGTIITVAVATVPWLDVGRHGFDVWDMLLGLLIATVKATLVAVIFMHLNHEKITVYWVFGLGLALVAFMAALLALADVDPIEDDFFYGSNEVSTESH